MGTGFDFVTGSVAGCRPPVRSQRPARPPRSPARAFFFFFSRPDDLPPPTANGPVAFRYDPKLARKASAPSERGSRRRKEGDADCPRHASPATKGKWEDPPPSARVTTRGRGRTPGRPGLVALS